MNSPNLDFKNALPTKVFFFGSCIPKKIAFKEKNLWDGALWRSQA